MGFAGRFQATTRPTDGKAMKVSPNVRKSTNDGRLGISSVPGATSDMKL